ncbi:glycosyltransferase family 39 protein [Patescibacteria group bacterium]|nr:glycosyltransferase family 39 protein [Patescibacteria group bacterium]MCL5091452.1 glycosyltransferase family 39 protein [Patescibacteria group bacterium]
MKKHRLNRTIVVLALIMAVGIFLRCYRLNALPPGPEWDEASVGYNAFSIAQTGRDEWGHFLPLIFPAFGDYKNPLYIYCTAVFVKLFGLGLFSLRLTNVIAGVLVIPVVYLIGKLIAGKKVGVIGALFVAVSPFGIFFSRIAGDGIMLSSLFISAGVLMELYFIKTQKTRFLTMATITFILAMFSYNLGRVIAPLLLLTIFAVNYLGAKIRPRATHLIAIVFAGAALLLVGQQLRFSLSSRLQYVGIFGEKKGLTLEIDEYRGQDKNDLRAKILHNKISFTILTMASNYLSHFSTDFLLNYQNHRNVSESHAPPLYLVQILFYYFGLVLLFHEATVRKTGKRRWLLVVVIAAVAVAPLPSTITEGAPSGKRSLALHGLMELVTAYGLVVFFTRLSWKKISTRLIAATVAVAYLVNVAGFLWFFFFTYPNLYGNIYAMREREICDILKKDDARFARVVISRQIDGVPYIFPLFCLQVPLQTLWQTRRFRFIDGWYYVDRFSHFQFVDAVEPEIVDQLPKGKTSAVFVTDTEKQTLLPRLINDHLLTPAQMKQQSLPLVNDPQALLYLYIVKP